MLQKEALVSKCWLWNYEKTKQQIRRKESDFRTGEKRSMS